MLLLPKHRKDPDVGAARQAGRWRGGAAGVDLFSFLGWQKCPKRGRFVQSRGSERRGGNEPDEQDLDEGGQEVAWMEREIKAARIVRMEVWPD